MSNRRVVVGQLGCGYWGPNLARNLIANGRCELAVVADPSEDRRNFVQDRFPRVVTTSDFRTVIGDPSLEAVVIATPASTHEGLVGAALSAGKHVLVEKPLAMSVRGAEELVTAARTEGRVLMVGHTFLYNAAVRCLRDLVASGELGDVYYIYGQRVNLGQVRSDVNAWWNLAPHDVSILLHLREGKLPSSISAAGTASIQPGIEDVVFATLHWDDGVLGHIHVSWLDPGKIRRMTVVGDRKMAVYDDIADNKIEVWDKGVDRVPRIGERMDFDAGPLETFSHRAGDRVVPHIDFEEPLKVQIDHFLDCILDKREPLTGPEHGRDVVLVLEAGERALREGRSVDLPDS